MDREREQSSGGDKHQVRKADDIEPADESSEFEPIPPQSLFTQQMEKFAGTRLGLVLLRKADVVLKVLEETAKWSLPQDEEVDLQRPLPWIFFLCLIVWLRSLRFVLSVGANFFRLPPVTPKSMVYYIQTRRRSLRAIRIQGLKKLNSPETQETATPNKSTEENSFSGNVKKFLSSAICRPGQRHEAPATPQMKTSTKRTYKEADLQNLTALEILEKFASEYSDDDDDDSDYLPPANTDDRDDDDSSTSHNTTASADETKKSVEENNKNDEPKIEMANMQEVKENGETQQHSKPKHIEKNHSEYHRKMDDAKEQVHTLKQMSELKISVENGENKEMPLAVVAPLLQFANIPMPPLTVISHSIAHQGDKTTITPEHTAAACVKSSSSNVFTTDWTITIKTEITHNKHYPKLERLNHSANLSPASPTEDIFYSPMATSSTPLKAGSDEGASSVSPVNQTLNQRKHHPHNSHNKHHTHHYYNAKNRNKNRH